MVMFNTVAFLASMAHFRAMCSDPGTVPLPHSRMDFSDIHSGKIKSYLGTCLRYFLIYEYELIIRKGIISQQD